jgi:hypothetical protein
MVNVQSLVRENTSEREHLVNLITKLTDEQLSHPMAAGWTVSSVLAHLSFWDQRAIILINKWKKGGIGPSPIDTDVVNEATRLLCLAIAPRTAAELAISSATALDREIENLSQDLVEGIKTIGSSVHLDRAEHRKMHLGEIEKVLGLH